MQWLNTSSEKRRLNLYLSRGIAQSMRFAMRHQPTLRRWCMGGGLVLLFAETITVNALSAEVGIISMQICVEK